MILFFSLPIIEAKAQPKKCPVLSELEKTSLMDRHELVEALNTLIPKTVGNKAEENYFGMAKTFCGKEIAEKSWLVRLNFPKAPGADLAQGQIFLSKSKEKGWFVWFRYH